MRSSPAVGTVGTKYAGSEGDGSLYALKPDGLVKWTFATESQVASSPAIGRNGTIFFGSTDGNVYALNPDGTKRWHFSTGIIDGSSPSIACDGTIYIGTRAHRILALKPDGTKKWEFEMPNPVESSPAIGTDGTIYCTAQGSGPTGDIGSLIAISPSGAEIWRTTTDFPYSSPVIGSDGTIYVVAFWPTKLLAINPTNGAVKWRASGGANSYRETPAAPAVAENGLIYYGALEFGGINYFYAIRPDGTTNWVFNAGSPIRSSPTIGPDGTIYFGSANRLFAIRGAAPLANSVWPKYRQNLRNTGKVEKPALKKPKQRSDAGFEFQLAGETGRSYRIEATTNFLNWTSLTSFVYSTFPFTNADYSATSFPSRFYRAVQPPEP